MADQVAPHLFIVLGGTGDLMRRKLLPALYHLREQRQLGDDCAVLGVDVKDMTDVEYRGWAREALADAELRVDGSWCDDCLFYRSLGNIASPDYDGLAQYIERLEAQRHLPGNRVFYLALPPAAFPSTIEALGRVRLNRGSGWVRMVIEKPFGYDHASAVALNQLIHRAFDESAVYRIDHYLGKETVQNLLAFRFANPIFESLWNRDRVENVQITVAEDIGVGHRGAYYERTGALRDMLQNHLTQLFTLVGMEVPVAFESDSIRNEKLKVLQALAPLAPEDAVYGQYTKWRIVHEDIPGYRDEPGVRSDSETETFVALKLQLKTWRWQGVPFYLRTGKRMPRKITQIAVVFRKAPISLFQSFGGDPRTHSNTLLMTIQPNEGFSICFDVKMPGKPFQLDTRALHFKYQDAFGELADAYQTLLLDLLHGDQTLFVRGDVAEMAWQMYEPLLRVKLPIHPYPACSWGPDASDELLARQGHHWELNW